MKTLLSICIVSFVIFNNHIQAQEQEKKDSKLSVLLYGGIGFGKVENDNQPNYNMNSNSGDLLLNYNFSDKWGIATGAGWNQLSGNGFNSAGSFYHERDILKIPLLLTLKYNISDKFRLLGNLGPYTQTIISDEYRYQLFKVEDLYEGWNFGFQAGLGITYSLDDCLSFGINYNGQSDFSSFETNSGNDMNDEQKVTNLNQIGMLIIFDF